VSITADASERDSRIMRSLLEMDAAPYSGAVKLDREGTASN
jgi:hypothetical protein